MQDPLSLILHEWDVEVVQSVTVIENHVRAPVGLCLRYEPQVIYPWEDADNGVGIQAE